MIELLIGFIVIIAFMDLAGLGDEDFRPSSSMGSAELMRIFGSP